MTAETTRLPAVDAPQPLTPSVGGTGSRTGGLNPQGSLQAGEGHWLKWNTIARVITGCQCGFAADTDSDCGWGDSVVAHLLEVGADTAKPVHLHEAAASLKAIADHMPDTASAAELRPGIEYAATLLNHTADDLAEGATS